MKTKNLMAGLIVVVAFLVILPMSASADFIQESLDPVCFWLLDDDSTGDNGQVALSILEPFSPPEDYFLAYNIGSGWNDWDDRPAYFSVPTNQLIYFKLTNDHEYFADGYTSGDLTFSAYDGVYHTIPGYSSVMILWNDVPSTVLHFATATLQDHVGPVPIPATVWIFGAGLVGLVGIRKKLKS